MKTSFPYLIYLIDHERGPSGALNKFRLPVPLGVIGLTVIFIAAGFTRVWAAGPIPAGPGLQADQSNDLAVGLLLGWFLLLAGFSLLMWLSQRDLAGLYYLISLVFILMLLIVHVQPAVFPGESGSLLQRASLLWVALIAAFSILFINALVSARRLSTRLHRLVGPVIGLWVLLGVASFWLPSQVAGPVLAALLGLTVVYLALMAFISLARGYRPAAYAIVGLVVVLVGWMVGLAPAKPLPEVLPGISLMVMSLLFAAALYDHQRFTRANLERSYLSLRETETRLLQYMEALPFAAAVIGPDDNLVWFNQRFSELFAPHVRLENFPASLKELFYRHPIFKAGTTELYPATEFPAERALKGESVRSDDIELEREEGRFPLAVWAEPLLDNQRKPAAALVLCQDISARRQSEQELARHVQDLQLMVDLRLEELRYEHEDRKKIENVLHRLATTDPLTGLLNRRHWTSLADRYLKQSARYQHPLSLIMIDIDHFKFVNDIYGHRVGDETLIRIAATLRDTMRNVDLLARYGGDEFIILLPDTDLVGAEVVAERLRDHISNMMIECNKGPVVVTLSIGLAEIYPGQSLSLEEFVEQADLALYGAKHSGRNRVMTYAPMEVN